MMHHDRNVSRDITHEPTCVQRSPAASGADMTRSARVALISLTALYCAILFLGFDVAYSRFVIGDERQYRIPSDEYHHGLLANYSGHDVWGGRRYRLFTNSLGMKDGAVREVPAGSTSYRVLLIGDSFTEGIGLQFEETFAGMLYRAGQERSRRIEFLNAGASSNSPVIYYKKTKYLLDRGIHLDEVVVLSDPSDVQDEATGYFCIDDDPQYRRYCDSRSPLPGWAKQKSFLETYLVMTNMVGMSLKKAFSPRPPKASDLDVSRIGWLQPGADVRRPYAPLGVDGGIARSLQNMRQLADLLKARNIPLTIVVYPWISQLRDGDRNSRQAALWREFCNDHCQGFINLFPAFFRAKEADPKWQEHMFIPGDIHLSEAGNRIIYDELAESLFREH